MTDDDERSSYRWIEQARQRRPPTRFPFAATINDRRAIVWPDWIEYEDDDENENPDWLPS